MPAPRRRSRAVLRTRRGGLVPLGSAILRSQISAGLLLMAVWGFVADAGSGGCRCECKSFVNISLHSVGVCYGLVTYCMKGSMGVVLLELA